MISMRSIIACSALLGLMACAEGSKVETVKPDRPANFLLAEAAAKNERGELIEATHVVSLSKDEVTSKVGQYLVGFGLQAQNGVHIYRVRYRTQKPATPTDPSSQIVASGLIIVPDSKLASYPWIALQHGTKTSKAEAPSVSPSEGVFEGSLGFVTLVMDYIGYGASSKEFHPYLIERAYADAGVDFLKAGYNFAAQNTLGIGPLFLKGYSEGGYATLAIQREIETNHAKEFPLVASAPSGGPYNMDLVANHLMKLESVHPVNIPFLLLSYKNWLSNKVDFNLGNVFVDPVETIEPLFSGQFDNEYIGTKISTERNKVIKKTLVDDFLSPTPTSNEAVKLHAYLQLQSLTNKNWVPHSLTFFFHCRTDEVVPVESIEDAQKTFGEGPLKNISYKIFENVANAPEYRHTSCPAIFAPTVAFLEVLKQLAARK